MRILFHPVQQLASLVVFPARQCDHLNENELLADIFYIMESGPLLDNLFFKAWVSSETSSIPMFQDDMAEIALPEKSGIRRRVSVGTC